MKIAHCLKTERTLVEGLQTETERTVIEGLKTERIVVEGLKTERTVVEGLKTEWTVAEVVVIWGSPWDDLSLQTERARGSHSNRHPAD